MILISCPACGRECSAEASQCPQCGHPVAKGVPTQQAQPMQMPQTPPMQTPPPPGAMPPKTWLVESILATLLCCLPAGVVGIVYAAKVENLWYQGRREEAMQASRNAKTWTLVSFFVALGFILIYVLLIALGVFAGFAEAFEYL